MSDIKLLDKSDGKSGGVEGELIKSSPSLPYLPALHSAGSNFDGRLVCSERHDQPPDQLATALCDKSIARGDATSGSLVGINIKLFLPSGATVVW